MLPSALTTPLIVKSEMVQLHHMPIHQVDLMILVLFLCFRFYEPVYCLQPPKKHQFPSVSKEICGRWVGISENVGHAMMWLVLTDVTQKIHSVSEICSALDSKL